MQVSCHYIGAAEGAGGVPAMAFGGVPEDPRAVPAQPLPLQECGRLLQGAFVGPFEAKSGGRAPSFTALNVFVRVLGTQLQHMYMSGFYWGGETVEEEAQTRGLRTAIVRLLIGALQRVVVPTRCPILC